MIHAYSLIHDDLPAMDDDDIRRGKPTSHKKFNEADAILAGDGLQTLAFKIIADDKNLDSDIKIKLLHVLTNASFDMVLGQKLDINSGDNPTIEELENINKLKTGAILKASVLMGSIASGNDDKINQIFENFAENLAKAYQVQDDCFDFKDSTEIGKTNNANKTTFATI
jgi:geranylgeranyl pyrophosphate synthase